MQYNCRLYEYPTGQHVTFYKKTISRIEKDKKDLRKTVKKFTATQNSLAIENNEPETADNNIAAAGSERTEEMIEHSKNVSLSRTKNSIYNIARSNTWQWFITLTFDQTKTDSSDYDVVVHRLHTFLKNLRTRKCPDMKYLIVPELHKDGIHYHFHGLLSDVGGLRFTFSGHFDEEDNPIYNLPDWKIGFTTATQIKDSQRVSSYITKYITKDSEIHLKNKKRYMCSKNVERAAAEYFIQDEEEYLGLYHENIAHAKNIKVPAAHQSINYYELND
ncbi:MAG: hypothetical protein NC433_02915 [Clostridiales bacterium]|nr:hypothetical protein [Clostridiales bacterium]